MRVAAAFRACRSSLPGLLPGRLACLLPGLLLCGAVTLAAVALQRAEARLLGRV